MAVLFSKAADKNKLPIADALVSQLAPAGTILEIASGSGQHVSFFAPRFPSWQWLPTEFQAEKLHSIELYRAQAGVENIASPAKLDVCELPWQVPQVDAILNINMIHASTSQTAPALFKGARQILVKGGVLFLYGPFKFKQKSTAPSNEEFDQYLKSLDPGFGLWYFEDLEALAQASGLSLRESLEMPSNNHILIFESP